MTKKQVSHLIRLAKKFAHVFDGCTLHSMLYENSVAVVQEIKIASNSIAEGVKKIDIKIPTSQIQQIDTPLINDAINNKGHVSLYLCPVRHISDDQFIILCIDKFADSNDDNAILLKTIELIIENDRLIQLNDINEKKYINYLREVKTIKEKLLPPDGYLVEGLDYATYYRPSVGGGGDYFDFTDLRDARRRAGIENPPLTWGVGLLDVSGHGPGAAVEVAMVDAILRTYQGKQESSPADVINYINKHSFTRQSRGGYSTGIICNYDASTDILTYSSAGHLPILIKHHEGNISLLESQSGIPIGVEHEYQWINESAQLEPGDTIILFTDGITEAESISGEQFGMNRLCECIEKSHAKTAEPLMSEFMDTFHQHTSQTHEQDDQTLIMITIEL